MAGLITVGVAACGGSNAPAAAGTPAAASASTPASTPASSAPAAAPAAPSASGATGTCASQVIAWYDLTTGGKTEIANLHATWTNLTAPGLALAARDTYGRDLQGVALEDAELPAAMPACGDPDHAWATAMSDFHQAGVLVVQFPDGATVVPAATQAANSGFAALVKVAGEISKYTPAQP